MTWLEIGTITLALVSFVIIVTTIIPSSMVMEKKIIELEEQQQELKEEIARLNEKAFS
tara:strand:+ start:62 stop:235 length:174 start_codon:yes stop_codon:yes gene_type:complete